MEKLSQHIEKLLVLHDYVVVPDFGGFVIQQQSTEILIDKIKAPRTTVGFNPLMLHGDGLLVIEVSRFEKITYRQALIFVQNEVENLRLKLNSNETVQLGSVGYLQLNYSGNIIFTPANNIDFLPQNLGLSDLTISPKNKYKRTEITILLPSRRIYKYAAVVLMIFGLFLASPRVSDVPQSDYASFVPKFTEQPVEKASELETNLTGETTEETVLKINSETEKKFHVIVASLHSKKSAENFCNNLIDSDFKNAQVLDPIKTYRIAIESFSDKDAAIQYMENLRKTDTRFETAWVLCN